MKEMAEQEYKISVQEFLSNSPKTDYELRVLKEKINTAKSVNFHVLRQLLVILESIDQRLSRLERGDDH